MEWLDILMQWMHLTAAVTGVGGIFYTRLVLFPAACELPPEARTKLAERVVARMRPISFTVIAVLLITGFYNVFSHMAGHSPAYHPVLGLKILLGLHLFILPILLPKPPALNPAPAPRPP